MHPRTLVFWALTIAGGYTNCFFGKVRGISAERTGLPISGPAEDKEQPKRQSPLIPPPRPDFRLEELTDLYPRTRDVVPIIFGNESFNPQPSYSLPGTTEVFIVTKSHGNPPAGQIRYASNVTGGGWEQAIYAGDDDKSVEMWLRRISFHPYDDGELDIKNAPSKSVVRLVFDGHLYVGDTNGVGLPFSDCVEIDNAPNATNRNSSNIFNTTKATSAFYLVVFTSDNRGTSTYRDQGTSVAVKSIRLRTDDPSFFYVTDRSYFYDSSQGCLSRGAIASVQLLHYDATKDPAVPSLATNATAISAKDEEGTTQESATKPAFETTPVATPSNDKDDANKEFATKPTIDDQPTSSTTSEPTQTPTTASKSRDWRSPLLVSAGLMVGGVVLVLSLAFGFKAWFRDSPIKH